MEIGLRLSQVGPLRRRDDTDGDAALDGVEKERIKKFIVVDDEVDVEPEGLGEDDLSELSNSMTAWYCDGLRLSGNCGAGNHFREDFQIVGVGPLFALLLDD